MSRTFEQGISNYIIFITFLRSSMVNGDKVNDLCQYFTKLKCWSVCNFRGWEGLRSINSQPNLLIFRHTLGAKNLWTSRFHLWQEVALSVYPVVTWHGIGTGLFEFSVSRPVIGQLQPIRRFCSMIPKLELNTPK